MLLFDRFNRMLLEEGGEGGEGGAPIGAPEGEGGSAISGGAPEPAFHERIPEKFRVFEGDGDDKQFNLESSADKLLNSYTELEKSRSAPEKPEDYQLDTEALGEGFDAEAFMSDESTQSFLKRMHAKGMSNAQVQEVVEYGLKEWAPNLMQGNQGLTTDQALEHIKKEVWTEPSTYTENMGAANRAFMSLPEDMRKTIDGGLGNDPAFLQVMAMFGQEMKEDTPVTEETGNSDAVEIEKLMLSDAYKNPKNPEHEKVSKQVKAYFEKKNPRKTA